MQTRSPYEVQSNIIKTVLSEEIQRIDAYLLGYLKQPSKDRLEYMTFLLSKYLESSPRFRLDSVTITYETAPSEFSYSPLFPKDKESKDIKELREEVLRLKEINGSLIRENHVLKFHQKNKRSNKAIIQPPESWLDPDPVPVKSTVTKPKEKLKQSTLSFKGLSLPYVIDGKEMWFIALPTLKALGIGEHWIKRTHLGGYNKRRDLSVEGSKRPSLINLEAIRRLAKQAGRYEDISIEGLDVLVAQVLA